MGSPLLTKSRYLNGLQCPRLLWITVNRPEQIGEPDIAVQYRFDQGQLVSSLARKLFPGGVEVPADDFTQNILTTKRLLGEAKPLFEAGVLSGRLYARSDILVPAGEGVWDVIEVKSSTSVKEQYYRDVAFQKLCWEEAGVSIGKCFVVHINKQYLRDGHVDPEGLFVFSDISDGVARISRSVRDEVISMLKTMSSRTCPDVDIGHHCHDPYPCPLKKDCWEGLPEHNVFTLYSGGEKSLELYRMGVLDIKDIPADCHLEGKQRIQYLSVVSRKVYVDAVSVKEFLDALEYPLYYLDFEAFATAVPLFDGTRPYQHIPFQFSLHIQKTPHGRVQHHSFLADDRSDPRQKLLLGLVRLIGDKGSILVYDRSFEKRILEDLAELFPEYADWVASVTSRLVDLSVPFRHFYCYHPAQKGSASLKSVLPALTRLSYDWMPIADGDSASVAFLSAMFGEVSEAERSRLRQQLLDYCRLDTWGMVQIVRRLKQLVAGKSWNTRDCVSG